MSTYENYPTTRSDAAERYRYLLRTASPDQIEQAHEQAFAQMDPEERQQVLRALATTDEVPADDSPAALARSATRLEVRQPGTLDRLFGGSSGVGRALLGSLAAGFVGSAVFDLFFDRPGGLFGLGGLFGSRGFGGGHGLFGGGGMGGFGGGGPGGPGVFGGDPGGPGGF